MTSEAELIKSRIRISEIIGRKIHLKNRRGADYVAICPFHKEKTPSFFVNDEKAIYHCFGCGAGGDVFTFLMKYDGLNYKEALQNLAEIAGVALKKGDSKVIAQMKKNEIFFQIYKATADFYHAQLFLDVGKRALDYITARKITKETVNHYKLGFAPKESYSLLRALCNKFSESDLLESGIIKRKNDFTYNPFFNRLIFPIQDKSGKFIGFGGRALDENQQPKYLNSAENPIFQKSQHLYGYNFAKSYIYRQEEVVVVEGYMDVIALANNGIHNSVAPLGANIKLSQVALLWESCTEPTICFDNDAAGQNAAIKIAYESLKIISHDKSLKFIKLQSGKDPDEIIKNKGASFFRKLLKESIPLADYIFNNEVDKLNLNTPEKKILLKKNTEKIAHTITDQSIKQSYLHHFRDLYYKLLSAMRNNKKSHYKLDREESEKIMYPKGNNKENLYIISVLCNYPELLNENAILEEFIKTKLPNNLDKIRKILLDIIFDDDIDESSLYNKVNAYFQLNIGVKKTLEELKYLNTYASKDDARTHLLKTFDIKQLEMTRKEVKDIKEQLSTKEDIVLMKRMLHLKEYERQLQNKIRNN